jgi:hypothetical protein
MGEFKLPFRAMGLAGAFGVGKTLACLDLLVMARKAGVPKDELLVIDTHGSVEPYLMLEQYQNIFTLETCLDIDHILKFFDALVTKIEKRETPKKRITVIDTVELIQDKIIENTWEDPSLSDAYKEKNISFMWGRAKKTLLRELLKILVRLTKSCIFTIHTRGEFVGNKPTGRQQAKFLAPIWQICQAVAVLTREANKKLPDALFMPPLGKSQFPALPPRIQEFTWTKFFGYIGQTPADWGNLKKEEVATEGLELLTRLEKLGGVNPDAEGSAQE